MASPWENNNKPNALKGQKHMSQSLCKIYLHIIFHIKTTSPQIAGEHIDRVHSYIGQLVNATGCQVIRVGGVGDHVHIVWLLKEVKREVERVKFESNSKLNIRQLVNAIVLAFIKEHNENLENMGSG